VKSDIELALKGGAEDHLPNWPGVVVDVPDSGVQALVVERGCPAQAHLFLRREQKLDPAMGTVLGHHPTRCLEHRGDGRLVVRAENRAARVPNDAVLDDGLKRPLRRHSVEMGAEEERRAASVRLDTGVEIADRGFDPRAGVILVN